MSKRALLRFVASIYLMLCVMFLCQISVFADEVEPVWTRLASMTTSRNNFKTEVINGKIYAMGGNGIKTTEVYDPTTDKWTKLADMSVVRSGFQTEVINGKIYAMGGNGIKSTEVYDPTTDKWTKLADMSTVRSSFQSEVVDGKIYVIGGTDLKSIEVYDPTTNEWTKLADMSVVRSGFQTEVVDGKIYAIGGNYDNYSYTNTSEVYDPITNEWMALANMPTARSGFQTEVIGGKIYAIGGYNGSEFLDKLEIYDITTNEWTILAPMHTPRASVQTEVINGMIYTIGGYWSNGTLKIADKYDPTTNEWTLLDNMSTTRSSFQTEEINGKIYAIGGTSGNSLSSMEVYTVSAITENQLKATGGDSKVDLTWDVVDKATSYIVKRSITAGGPYTKIATGVTGTAYTDKDVTNETTYYYVVTAIINGSQGWNSNEASATPQASTDPNQPTGNKALLVISMITGERKEYEMTTDKINNFITWYNSKAASSPTYVIEKDYNKASFTARKDYIAYEQISNFEVNEYNN